MKSSPPAYDEEQVPTSETLRKAVDEALVEASNRGVSRDDIVIGISLERALALCDLLENMEWAASEMQKEELENMVGHGDPESN